jgi:hypothetical protein
MTGIELIERVDLTAALLRDLTGLARVLAGSARIGSAPAGR